MNKFFRQIINYDVIIIFGASDIGLLIEKEIKAYCKETNKLLCFADNSYKKWDKAKNVLRPIDAATKYPNALWFIASDRHSRSMYENLRELNVDPKNIVTDMMHDFSLIKQGAEKSKRLTKQKELTTLDVFIAYHCNLNCAGCGSFSPLVMQPTYEDIDIFKRDIERLSHLLNRQLKALRFLGGEPLLNQKIEDFVKTGRKYFPDSSIAIITNGILLTKMPESFWLTCRDDNIVLSITRYPIHIDYNELQNLAERHKVNFEFFGIAVEKTTWNFAFDPTGKQDPKESFINCHMANECPVLKNGKIYPCSSAADIEFFNQYFGTEMMLCSSDYVDIYKVQDGDSILDFLSKQIPFCRFCNTKNRTYDNPWHISKREIGEWTCGFNQK